MTKQEIIEAAAGLASMDIEFDVRRDHIVVHSDIEGVAPSTYYSMEELYISEVMGRQLVAGRF